MKRLNIIITILILVGLLAAGAVMAEPLLEIKKINKVEYVKDEIVIKIRGDIERFRVIKVPRDRVEEKIKEYLKRYDVEYAEPNYIAYALMVPNDPYYSYQWHLDNSQYGGISMEGAWDISTGSGVTVAVIDTGISKGSDLANTCFVSGYDFVNNDSNPSDDNGHGTHVAGTVAQSTNNNLGIAGVAFGSCLMPIKVLNQNGSGSYADVANGIYWAVNHGAKVINLSLGGSADSQTLKDAVAYAYNQGVTVVAAAGNDSSSNINYPAGYDDYVIAIGATQYDESLAPYSNYGSSLDLVAPGGNLNVDQNNDSYGDGVLQQTFERRGWRTTWGYYFMQGTSMASPHVAGVAALVLANGNATTPDEIRNILQETAEDLGTSGRDNTYGYGLVDAYEALNWNAGPACLIDADCDDGLSCTDDSCVDGACLYSPDDTKCPADGWFETGNMRWVSISQCAEKEQKEQEYRDYYCGLTSDCQYNITNTQWIDSGTERDKADGTSCDDGQFCTTNDSCQTGICTGGEVRDCDDGVACTIDSCDEDLNICLNIWPACGIEDGCCGPECDYNNDPDCSAASLCWDGSNEYLYRSRSQLNKFCKCAQGIYKYNSYRYSRARATVYQYVDSGDNENWQVDSRSSYLPVYEVICSDNNSYITNQNYYWPK